jgi:transcriptional regulator with XRE-family HTH domain
MTKDDLITLREARLNAGLSQKEAAELSNIPQTTVSHYEKDMCKPSTDRFKKLCFIYGYSTDDIRYPADNRWERRRKKLESPEPESEPPSDLRYIIECQKSVMESQRQMLVMQQQIIAGLTNEKRI